MVSIRVGGEPSFPCVDVPTDAPTFPLEHVEPMVPEVLGGRPRTA